MAHTEYTTILIHPLAPAKVAVGAACNGCGVCCLYAPCPVGMLLSGRRKGACSALRWDETLTQYRCGAITASQEVLAQALPRGLRWLAPVGAPALRSIGVRWVAAGTGCDSSLEIEGSDPATTHAGLTDTASTTIPASDLQTHNPGGTAVRHPPHDRPPRTPNRI